MKKNSLTLSLPEWIDDFLKQYQFPLVSNEERMRFVLKLTLQNIEKTTGGPFGATVFERESGQLVSVGVNVVLNQGCSAAHAEMMAIMLAQQELGTHDLGIADLPEFQLVTSGKMCAMCLGSVVWSGVREVLASAQPEDVENIVGFDEGLHLPIMTSSWKNVESASFLLFSGKKDVQSCIGMSNWKVLFIILPGTPESSLFHKIFPPETVYSRGIGLFEILFGKDPFVHQDSF